ncbi:hypothetical protein QYG89_15775 [Bacillus sp. B190/17]|uniref:Uncharacterized protein n=1 Tax=Bacillus lumedeiriae TaxID=3058829 RepID=A0ABW8IEJ7_9BACI
MTRVVIIVFGVGGADTRIDFHTLFTEIIYKSFMIKRAIHSSDEEWMARFSSASSNMP